MGVKGDRVRVLSKHGWKKWAIAALLAVVLTGCGAADQSKSSEYSAGASDSAKSIKTDSNQSSALAVSGAEGNRAEPQAASVPAQAPNSYNGTSLTSVDAPDRKIIYRASMTMQVDKYEDAQQLIEDAVRQSGGYVLQFNQSETAYEKSGNFVIKVPVNGFSSLLNQLEKIHSTSQKSVQGQDVSEEYVDLTARLNAKQVVEKRLVAFMEKASKTDELLAFSNELGKVQEEIERIKGRMRYLEQNVSYSTIELRLVQKMGSAAVIKGQEGGPLVQRAASAWSGSTAVLSVILQWIVIVAAAVLPVAIVLAVILIPTLLVRRSRKKKQLELRKKLTEENRESIQISSNDEERPEA
ncbi:DUF4349 domain-containing protein [Paenibacillus sp. OAS669]|uniref:DUF4349 domain-containing protein n=1 Tax=Paenibacillus sp. OAS669 TaxID=2663821 RepID=UPI00178A3C78|nr:DUF4349 domain-containing protein [Paenibacillus sp. OAS669]MBE1443228.1 hypothetical protein [Paenibacillus sp. OAS669]